MFFLNAGWRSTDKILGTKSISKSSLLFLSLALGSPLHAMEFGSRGTSGRHGQSGRNGRYGQAITLQATGAAASYDISGQNGENGLQGESGLSATGCIQGRPSFDLNGASGGDGGRGGGGGQGGNGGPVTIYYNDIEALKSVYIKGTPGIGGRGAWGGRGGQGCRCQVSQWTVGTQTFRCRDGFRGSDASQGFDGARGSYGHLILVNQLTPVLPETPSYQVDMGKMEAQVLKLSKNHWQAKTGGVLLFQPGSDVANSYSLYTGRTELTLGFRWDVARPITDFNGKQMSVELATTTPKVSVPGGLWVNGALEDVDGKKTYVFKNVVHSNEIAYLQFSSFGGVGADHTIAIKDNAGVSSILNNKIHLTYYAVENGAYKSQYDADVPADKVTVTPKEIKIQVGALGINPDALKRGTQAHAKVLITRSLGANAATYVLSSNYVVNISININDHVIVLKDSNLYSGTTVVGAVKKDEIYAVSDVQGDWINLKKLDGTVIKGWIQSANLDLDHSIDD